MNGSDLDILDCNIGEAVESIRRDLSKGLAATAHAVQKVTSLLDDLREVAATQRVLSATLAAQLVAGVGPQGDDPRFLDSTLGLLDDWTALAAVVAQAGESMAQPLVHLGDHIETMQQTTSAVDKLARESRFIAFNARIQIQRARGSGETFKVIAEEVKRLAGETARLSLRINQSVKDSRQELASLGTIKAGLVSMDMTAATQTRATLLSLVQQVQGWHDTFEQTIARITNFIADAVRAAQFDDIVTQILEGSARKISALHPLIVRSLKAAAMPSGLQRDEEVQSLVLALDKLAKTETQRQTSLDPSGVELF